MKRMSSEVPNSVKKGTHAIVNALKDLIVEVAARIRVANREIDAKVAQHLLDVIDVGDEKLGARVADRVIGVRAAIVVEVAASPISSKTLTKNEKPPHLRMYSLPTVMPAIWSVP